MAEQVGAGKEEEKKRWKEKTEEERKEEIQPLIKGNFAIFKDEMNFNMCDIC